MWELDCKESWTLRNWCFWTVLLEKMLESPLDFKEIKPAKPKANQSWMYIGRTDAEAATPIFWPPHVKNWLIGKDPDAGKDWRQEKKGLTEDEMVGWHYWLDGHGFEQTPSVGDGLRGLVCWSPWCQSIQLSGWTELNWKPLTVWMTKKLQKILQEMGIPDHLTCLLRNLYAGREAMVRIGHGAMGWFQIGIGVPQGCIL